MYSINLNSGIVTRDIDNVVVSPVDSVLDPLFLEYSAWCNLGNIPTILADSLSDVKKSKIDDINSACQRDLALIVYGYPDLEIATWPTQSAEAEALLLDPLAKTPMLTQVAVSNNVPVLMLANLIAGKSAAYKSASGAIVGKRQSLTAKVNACIDVASVLKIVW